MSRDLTIATMFHPQDRYQKEIPKKIWTDSGILLSDSGVQANV